MTARLRTQVLIAGGGPVGMMLALELARFGVRSIVANDGAETASHPKANAINARTMEHLRRHGLARPIRAQGVPRDHPTDVCYVTRLTGFELGRLEMPTPDDALAEARAGTGPYDCAEPPHRCSQLFLEATLKAAIDARPEVDVRFGHRLEAFTEDAGAVVATVRQVVTDETVAIEANYLVGADGGHSVVRQRLDIAYEGDAGVVRKMMGGAMLGTYFEAPRDAGWLTIRRAWQYWVVNRDVRALLLTVDGADRWLMMTRIPDEADPASIDDRALVTAAAGRPVPMTVLSRQPWTAGHALLAQSFGRGRVWLAGDAAHLFTPTGGLGMNTGIDDAVNLAWKLAGAVQGWAGPRLLASYEADRRPVGARNVAFARAFAESIGTAPVPAEIERDSAIGETERFALGARLADHGRREFVIPGIALGVRYEDSALVTPDGTPRTPDDPYNHVPTARPGSRAPHVWRADGSALCDHFADGFTLLRAGATAPVDDLVDAAAARGVPLVVVDAGEPAVRARFARDLALIGPDGHVYWRGDRAPGDAGAVIERVRGA